MDLAQILGVAVPLIQAPMAGVQDHRLAVAVCAAGAVGSLPCSYLGHEQLRAEIAALSTAASTPYNVNFFCHPLPAPDAAREQAWRTTLHPFYTAFAVEPPTATTVPRATFDAEVVAILRAFRPPIVSFHFGLPDRALLAALKDWGATIVSSATTVAEARWLEAHGADVIIAQGWEAGGHRAMFLTSDLTTQLGTFALVPQIVAAVRRPVVAAGGIADERGIAAALALGASGVQIGTAFLLCDEARTSAPHRAAIQRDDAHTAVTNLFTGRPARGVENALMRALGPLRADLPAFPLAAGALVPLRAAAEAQGRDDATPLWAGQNRSGCRTVSATTLVQELAAGFVASETV